MPAPAASTHDPTPVVPPPDRPPNDYEWDVFLSYADGGYPGAWVRNTFRELLVNLMDAEGRKPRIYYFRDEGYGKHWKANLRRALATSRLMVCVWSPGYFSAKWCKAEFQAMLDREEKLGIAAVDDPRSLVWGVRYFDGKYFSQDAKDRGWFDAEPWDSPLEDYSKSLEWDGLRQAAKPFARQLVERLHAPFPEWDPSWLEALEDEEIATGTLGGADTGPIRKAVL